MNLDPRNVTSPLSALRSAAVYNYDLSTRISYLCSAVIAFPCGYIFVCYIYIENLIS